jgi:hypothetical protein
VPLVVDTTNSKLSAYFGGRWRSTPLGDGSSAPVATTANGGNVAGNNANTWCKIATITPGTTVSSVGGIEVKVSGGAFTPESATVYAGYQLASAAGGDPTLFLNMVSKSGSGGASGQAIPADAFKLVSGGWNTDIELWMRKGTAYGSFSVFELSRYLAGGGTLAYNNGGAWQAAAPTGVVNASTSGVSLVGSAAAPPAITVSSHDAYADLVLKTKGTGVVKVGTAPVVTGVSATAQPLSLWSGTKAEYDAIATKSPTTIYVVTPVTAVTGDITVDEGVETGDIMVEPPTPEVVADETAAEPKAAPATKSTRKK